MTARLSCALGLGGFLLSSSGVRAQVLDEPVAPYPDPRKFARGLFVEADAGAVLFIGGAAAEIGPGAALGLRLGYELGRFVALRVSASGSTHTLRALDTPQSDQLLQLYQGGAELGVKIPVGQWTIFALGRAGYALWSSNILGTLGRSDIDKRRTPLFGGGAGVDYHTQSRHNSFGLGTTYVRLQSVPGTAALCIGAYAKYVF